MERMMVKSGSGDPRIVTKAELLKRCRRKTFDFESKIGALRVTEGGTTK
jgi:hypothetical protein